VTLGAQLLPGLFPGFVARYRDRLAPEVVAVGERLMPRVHGYLADQPRPWTVQHGDYRLDNLLFGDGSRAPALAVVDWQTAIHGPGPADVSYFLGAGLAAEDRRAHEEALVREYHAALRAGGVEGYGWDRCWEDYRRYAYAGYLMAVGASMVVEQTERGDEMFLAMARRHAAQVVDLDSEALLR
jgi:aminoglycoside phosphotransferase (APT) family kinase protein